MITVLCSECKDPLELAGRSVTIPYVCDECKEAAELRDAMAPAIKSYDEFPNLIDVPEPSHEATIENTTLLIEDLEEQVRRGLDQIKQDTELLSDMDKRNTELAIHNSDLHRLNERLQMDMSELFSRLDKLRDQNTALGTEKFQIRQGVAKFIGEMFQISIDADKAVSDLQSDLDAVSSSRDFYQMQATYFRHRMKDYIHRHIETKYNRLNRGLFARIFNVKPRES